MGFGGLGGAEQARDLKVVQEVGDDRGVRAARDGLGHQVLGAPRPVEPTEEGCRRGVEPVEDDGRGGIGTQLDRRRRPPQHGTVGAQPRSQGEGGTGVGRLGCGGSVGHQAQRKRHTGSTRHGHARIHGGGCLSWRRD